MNFFAIAVGATIIYTLKMCLTLLGAGGDHDISTGHDAPPVGHDGTDHALRFLTIDSIAAFFMGFGWTGSFLISGGEYGLITIFLVSSGVGFVFGGASVGLATLMQNLKEENQTTINDALGQTGNVYLKVPREALGHGVVHLKLKAGMRELEALTYEKSDIEFGKSVKVKSILGDKVVVETLSNTESRPSI